MTEAEIYAGLQKIFDQVFPGRGVVVTPELSAADVPGWDSFRQVSIIIGVEELFGHRFHDADIDDLRKVSDLARILMSMTDRET